MRLKNKNKQCLREKKKTLIRIYWLLSQSKFGFPPTFILVYLVIHHSSSSLASEKKKPSCSLVQSFLSCQTAVETRTGPRSICKGSNGSWLSVWTTVISHIKLKKALEWRSVIAGKGAFRMCCFVWVLERWRVWALICVCDYVCEYSISFPWSYIARGRGQYWLSPPLKIANQFLRCSI